MTFIHVFYKQFCLSNWDMYSISSTLIVTEQLSQQEKDRAEVQDILDNFDPDLEAMINELAPNGHQKMIFKQGPDDPAPRILGVSTGPMELVWNTCTCIYMYRALL